MGLNRLTNILTFHKVYFSLTVLIFSIEVLIAAFVRDNFIRPYLGDVLVVILIYCFIKSFLNLPVIPVAIGVLLFSFTIEFLQYINIVKLFGLENHKTISIIVGTSFSWADLAAYAAGILLVVIIEKFVSAKLIPS